MVTTPVRPEPSAPDSVVTTPVRDEPSPENEVAEQIPVTSTPGDVVSNLLKSLWYNDTL